MKDATARVYDSAEIKEKGAPLPSLRKKLGLAKSEVRCLKKAIAKVRRQEKRLEKLTQESARLREEYRNLSDKNLGYWKREPFPSYNHLEERETMSEAIAKRAYDTANLLLKINAVPFEEEESNIHLTKKAEEFGEKGKFTIDDIQRVGLFTEMAIASFLTTVVASKRHPSFKGTDEELAKVASEFACETIGTNVPWESTHPSAKEGFIKTIASLRKGEDDGILDTAMSIAPESFCMLEIMFRSYAKHLLDVTAN